MDKLMDVLDDCIASEEEDEEEEEKSKLKRKQNRKLRQLLNPEERFRRDMYSRIIKGETFDDIFEEILATKKEETIERLNRLTQELQTLESKLHIKKD